MALDDDASSSSSCATSVDRMAIKLRIVRRKKDVASTDAGHNAATTKAPKAESPRKSPTKRKKKATTILPEVLSVDGMKAIASKTKKKTVGAEGPIRKSPTKGKKPVANKSTTSSLAANFTAKTLPEGVNATLGSPTKMKKDSKSEDPHAALVEPKAASPRKSKTVEKSRKEATDVNEVPFTPEVTKVKKKKTTAAHDSVQQESNSVPKRPQTAPNVCKKKVMLSSDDDSSVEKGQLVPIKTTPLTTPPSRAKSRFTFTSSDDGSSSDSSDESFGQKRYRTPCGKKRDEEASHAQHKIEWNSLSKQDTSVDSDSSTLGEDSALPKKLRNDEQQQDATVRRSVPPRTYSGESTDSEPPFPLNLRPGGRKVGSMSLGSTNNISDDSDSSSVGEDSDLPNKPRNDEQQQDATLMRSVPPRTYSGESTDSEPPFPLDLRPGGRKIKSMSLGSTDSEPPLSLDLRPGQLSRVASTQAHKLPLYGTDIFAQPNHSEARKLKPLTSYPSYVPSCQDETDRAKYLGRDLSSSESKPWNPMSLKDGNVTMGKPQRRASFGCVGTARTIGHERSASTQAHKLPCYGTDIFAQPNHSEARKLKPLTPYPSYVPSCQDETDRAKYLGRDLSSLESKPWNPISLKDGNVTMDKPQRRASFGCVGTARTIGSPMRSVQEGACRQTEQQLTESNQNLPIDVKLRPVVVDTRTKKKRPRRRRESFLFKDLQRFAKKTAKEIQSDDEGVSDDGVSDEGVSDIEPLSDDRRDEFCGDQSLNLHDVMDRSHSGGHGTDFYQSAPILAMPTNINTRSAVVEPITPKFEEIRKMLLQETSKNKEVEGGDPQSRRHSSLIETECHASKKPSRRHSTLPIGAFQDDSQSSNDGVNRPKAEKLDQRKAPDRAPSASLTNVVPLKDRIKLLSLDDSVKWQDKAEERPSSGVHPSIHTYRFSKTAANDHPESTSCMVDDSTFLSMNALLSPTRIYRRHGVQTVNDKVKADEWVDKPCFNSVSSSMDALLSPNKKLLSRPSTTNHLYGIRTDMEQANTQMVSQRFNKSMGKIQSDKSLPTASQPKSGIKPGALKKTIVDKNNDSLEDLKAIAEALQTEIDKVDKNNDSSNSGSGNDRIGEENPDKFDKTGLTQHFSTKKPKVQTKEDDDDKSRESTLSYDEQDVLTSFSQQRELAMQRARATARPSGGKLGDRLKFLQSS